MCKDNIAAYDRRISPHRESSRMASSGPPIGVSFRNYGRQAKRGEGFYWAFSLDMVT
jgi:hypothetical protein